MKRQAESSVVHVAGKKGRKSTEHYAGVQRTLMQSAIRSATDTREKLFAIATTTSLSASDVLPYINQGKYSTVQRSLHRYRAKRVLRPDGRQPLIPEESWRPFQRAVDSFHVEHPRDRMGARRIAAIVSAQFAWNISLHIFLPSFPL